MSNKKVLITLAVVALVVAAGVSAVSAYQIGSNNASTSHSYNLERHAAMQKALQDRNYQAWLSLVGDRPITQKINRENFNKFVEAWRLAQRGEFEQARILRQELGLNATGHKNWGKRLMSRGAHTGGCFIDANHDGVCDHFDQK